MTWILTHTARTFDVLNPRAEDVDLHDIAHALANNCRFSGHTHTFYSVAEHSIHVCNELARRGSRDIVQLYGLLHDAAEAYITDIPAPYKYLVSINGQAIAEIEHAIEYRIFEALIPAEYWSWDDYAKCHAQIKAVDLAMLATERQRLLPKHATPWPVIANVTPAPVQVGVFVPGAARHRFIAKYNELINNITRPARTAELRAARAEVSA